MGKLIKKLTILATLLTFALGTTIVYADEEETISANEDKELVLYNADGDINGDGEEDLWIGFRWLDEDGYTCFDITYAGKTLQELEDEGFTIEYAKIDEKAFVTTGWLKLNDIFDFLNPISGIGYNIYKIRLLYNENIISVSDSFRYSSENPNFPIAISSTPYSYYRDNFFDGKSMKITLKYDDCLELINPQVNSSISFECFLYDLDPKEMNIQYSITNFEYKNYSEKVIIDEVSYDLNYCIITCICNFANINFPDMDYDTSLSLYEISTFNLKGTNYDAEPNTVRYASYSYKDQSKNPQKEAVITDHTSSLPLSESTTLNVDILSDEVSADDITFVSSDDMVVSVDENGLVTANSVGTAYIYAESKTSDEVYDYCIINVYDSSLLVPVSSIKLDKDIVSLQTGSETTLTATVLPENSIDKSVTWSSSNEGIATVSEDGTVTAIAAGECIITCTSNYNDQILATSTIMVVDPIVEVDKIEYEAPSKVRVGKKFKIKITVLPKNASRTDVKFSSSNTKYATVNSNGVVTTKKAGAGKTVTITISATDSSKIKVKYSFKIEPIKVTKVTLTSNKTTVKVGKKAKIRAKILPTNATNKNIKWKVSNTKYATISTKGLLKAKKAGAGKTVKVTATAKDGSKKYGTIKIRIKK